MSIIKEEFSHVHSDTLNCLMDRCQVYDRIALSPVLDLAKFVGNDKYGSAWEIIAPHALSIPSV